MASTMFQLYNIQMEEEVKSGLIIKEDTASWNGLMILIRA